MYFLIAVLMAIVLGSYWASDRSRIVCKVYDLSFRFQLNFHPDGVNRMIRRTIAGARNRVDVHTIETERLIWMKDQQMRPAGERLALQSY